MDTLQIAQQPKETTLNNVQLDEAFIIKGNEDKNLYVRAKLAVDILDNLARSNASCLAVGEIAVINVSTAKVMFIDKMTKVILANVEPIKWWC